MTVRFKVDWTTGTFDTGADTYTQATPETPNAGVLALIDTYSEQTPSSGGFAGRSVLQLDSWNAGVSEETVSSLSGSGRLLVQYDYDSANPPGGDARLIRLRDAATTAWQLRIYINSASTPYLWGRLQTEGGSFDRNVTFSAFSDVACNIEVVFDTNNATSSERFKMRYWDIGSSPGSWTSHSSGGTDAQVNPVTVPDALVIADPGNGPVRGQVGTILISDDPTEDLSALLEQQGNIAWIRA